MQKRRSIRLKGYNYSDGGLYFVTICAQDRECLFGGIIDEKMVVNDVGEMVNDRWLHLPERFENVELEAFQIMPNHIHGIIRVVSVGARSPRPSDAMSPRPLMWAPRPSDVSGNPDEHGRGNPDEHGRGNPAPTRKMALGQIVAYFKYQSTKSINLLTNTLGKRIWQRNYHEHIVRDEEDLGRICEYIGSNPRAWAEDMNNPLKFKTNP